MALVGKIADNPTDLCKEIRADVGSELADISKKSLVDNKEHMIFVFKTGSIWNVEDIQGDAIRVTPQTRQELRDRLDFADIDKYVELHTHPNGNQGFSLADWRTMLTVWGSFQVGGVSGVQEQLDTTPFIGSGLITPTIVGISTLKSVMDIAELTGTMKTDGHLEEKHTRGEGIGVEAQTSMGNRVIEALDEIDNVISSVKAQMTDPEDARKKARNIITPFIRDDCTERLPDREMTPAEDPNQIVLDLPDTEVDNNG